VGARLARGPRADCDDGSGLGACAHVWSVTPAGSETGWCGTSSSTDRRRPLFRTVPARSGRGQRDRTHRVGLAADVERDALELPAGPLPLPHDCDGGIIAALVNDTRSPERETITLLNTSPVPVSLDGWALVDKNQHKQPLSGDLPPGATRLWGYGKSPGVSWLAPPMASSS